MAVPIILCSLIVCQIGCAPFAKLSPLATLEKRLVYQGTPFPTNWDSENSPFEDVVFNSSDGTQLHGWFLDHPAPAGIALFCHGNAGNIASRADSLVLLNQRNRLAVMTFDYRGYGNSHGKPNERGILADAQAARNWLAKRKGIPTSEMILMGRSLGGAVAVDLASREAPKALVLASTFSSMPAVAKNILPLLPTRLLMTQRFNSIEKIHSYNGPLLQSHGDQDELIPIADARKLFDAANSGTSAPNEQKRFIVIPGGTHNSPQSEEYRVALNEFLSELPAISANSE